MIGVDTIGEIRRAYFDEHRPIKEIVRTLSVSRATVRKVIRSHKTEFKYEKLRRRLNGALSGDAALMWGDARCRQIFSINYGEVAYVDRTTYRANLDRATNPIQYAYLKDRSFGEERELRVSLSALGMGRFVLADGREIEFPPGLQLGFDFREACADGTIVQVLTAPTTDEGGLVEALSRLGIGPAPREPSSK